jgi:hypothetical protein
MKQEIVIRKNIYTGKEHKLIYSGTGKLYYFQPAESWMEAYINYIEDPVTKEKKILSLDSDGFGVPIFIGDIIDSMEVESIISQDDKICVMFK